MAIVDQSLAGHLCVTDDCDELRNTNFVRIFGHILGLLPTELYVGYNALNAI